MTRWQFDNGASVVTVASNSSSVTCEVPSLSTEHTGVYYCETIIDGITDTSMNYNLFSECAYTNPLLMLHVFNYCTHTYQLTYTNIHTYTYYSKLFVCKFFLSQLLYCLVHM